LTPLVVYASLSQDIQLNILRAARTVAIRKKGSPAMFDRAVHIPLRASIYILIFGAYAAAHPIPFINQPLVPAAASPGGSGFVLTVNGAGFVSGSTVNWNGGGRATTFVSASQLKANILAADIASPETASVTVSTPSPGGGTSNAVYFDVVLAAPAVLLSDDPFESTGFASFVGDFNGDGIMDLGTLDGSGNSVCILLANGDGSFQPETCYPTGDDTYPLSVTVGDFDGDGKLDLATANFEYPNMSVSILMGIGDGTFKPQVNYPTPGQAEKITNADFNGDGKSDLAVSNYSGGPEVVSIFLGNGDGTFQPYTNYPVALQADGIAVGDFNRDGKLDLAATNFTNPGPSTVSILLGNGDGTFQPHVDYPVGSQPNAVASADFDGDGKVDLAVVNYDSSSVSILLGNGDGTFRSNVDYPVRTLPFTVTVGDLNGDGKLDLAVSYFETNGGVSILLGNGDGSFQPHQDYPVAFVDLSPQVVMADFNRDGRLDLALGSSVLLQPPAVTLSPATLAFGTQTVGFTTIPGALTLTNTGTLTVSISGVTITGPDADDFGPTNGCPASLTPGSSCQINVTFTPSTTGLRTASLSVAGNAPNSPQTTALSGIGVLPAVSLSPTSLTFADQLVGAASASKPVTLTDTGAGALSIASIVASGAFSETNNCGPLVGQGFSCKINVVFKPTAQGTQTGSVSISDNAFGSPQMVALTGTGAFPAPSLKRISPASQTAGGTAFTLTVTGTKFELNSVVLWNGSSRATTYGSATTLTAAVGAADIANPGAASVAVMTPAPGGGTSTAVTFTIDNPVPVLTSLSPSTAIAGSGGFTLTVNGSEFVPGAVVVWAGNNRSTMFVSGAQLTASITAADVATAGSVQVKVTNPAPKGGTSNPLTFTVENPAPVASTLSPSSITMGSAAFTLTVTGSDFVGASTVKWKQTALTTTFVSGGKLTATVPASDIAAAGTTSVTVSNPAPGGGPSNGLTFTVNNPVPHAASLSPPSATAGAGSFTLAVNGSNFVGGAHIQWNAGKLVTTFAGGTQLTATIPAANIAAGGTASVTVSNPAPGGGPSNALIFTIDNPVPNITSIQPGSATHGGTAFSLTVRGTGFQGSSTVLWNGSPRTTTYISAAQLTAAITAADIATAGTASVTVTTPAPGGGTSGAATFTIR